MLLLNLGGPETLDDVQPFLYNLFADPDIIRLPSYATFLQPVVAKVPPVLPARRGRPCCLGRRLRSPRPRPRSACALSVCHDYVPGFGRRLLKTLKP